MTIDIGNAGHDAFLELVLGGYPDVAQHRAGELEKKPSMRLSHEPCLGMKVNWKRPAGREASQALVSLDMCAE